MSVLRAAACALVLWPALSFGQGQAKPDAITPDGGRYYGPLVDGKLHGRGRMEWPNGARYEGQFANGLMAGRGRLEVPQRELYEGEFKLGYYGGRGELVFGDGRKYRGDFIRGLFEGKGRFEDADGQVYEGDFAKGEFTGSGTYRRKDGARYDGEFKAWRFHGKGRYADGHGTYEGTFAKGDLSGPGTFKASQGQSYEGDFKHWRFHGKGVLRHPNGDVYRGTFENGFYEGQGTLTYGKPRPDGATQESGIWRAGALENRELRREAARNVEAVLYNQRALLANAIASLKPREPGRINLYLLAVGGDGSQEVFRREVEFVSRQFGGRFGTAGRTVALVNSRTTVNSAPMATMTSIREALGAIAARMEREQDILFLFLTSHGSREHEFVLSQTGMDLPDLPAAELARMLRESAIRWKVLVVSACYSGGFIEPLKDEHTLVITAARHDRSSFGCADENEFTYFGRAFFKESLPQASSFQDAFRRAEALVRKMELDEKHDTHSLPQIWSAGPIERQLQRWWQQKR